MPDERTSTPPSNDLSASNIDQIRKSQKEWEERIQKAGVRSSAGAEGPAKKFTTLSDMEVPLLSTPADLADIGFDYLRDSGFPGEFPYTRGVQRNMYRGKLWTMRQFAGFGSA